MLSKSRLLRITFSLALAGVVAISFSVQADDYSEVFNLIQSGKNTDAVGRADRFLASKPKDPQMRFLKGVAQTEAGRPADAVATFSKLTEDYPDLPEPYNNLAVIYASEGQFDKARATLEAALRTSPSYSTAHENLGDVYAKLASQAYINALQFDASNTTAKPKLALIRELFTGAGKDGKRSSLAVASASPMTPSAPVAATTPALSSQRTTAAPSASPVAKGSKPPEANTNQAPTPSAQEPTLVTSESDARGAVTAWAAAWSSKDMNGYFAAYAKEFSPPGKMDRPAWEAERRARILSKKRISVKIEQLQVRITGNTALAKFKQHYNADSLNVSSRKTLEMVRSGDRWLIVKEATGD